MENINMTRSYRSFSTDKTFYAPSDYDCAGDPTYWGYVSSNGVWHIVQDTKSTGSIRYAVGKIDYSTSWAGRASLTYKQFDLAVV